MKKLNEKTIGFINKMPCMTRVHSYDYEKGGGTLSKIVVNGPLVDFLSSQGKVMPSLDGSHEGWDFMLGLQTDSWVDLWLKRFAGVNDLTGLPVGVEAPSFRLDQDSWHWNIGTKRVIGQVLTFEEKYSENCCLYSECYMVIIVERIIDAWDF